MYNPKHKRLGLLIAIVVALMIVASPPPSLAADSSTGRSEPVTHNWFFNCTHIVRSGETLSMIAGRYGTSVWELMRANFIANPNRIFAGMALRVPCVAYTPPATCVRAFYIIRPGDDLYRIGLRFGVNYLTLAYFNGIANPNRIFWGMRLAIPCRGGYATYSNTNPYSPNPNPYMQPPPPTTGGSLLVTMQNISYQPASLSVRVGQTVMWRNGEGSMIPHTTTSGSCSGGTCTANGMWDSPQLNPGGTFSFSFASAGTFTYYCRVHGAAMQGRIVVSP